MDRAADVGKQLNSVLRRLITALMWLGEFRRVRVRVERDLVYRLGALDHMLGLGQVQMGVQSSLLVVCHPPVV